MLLSVADFEPATSSDVLHKGGGRGEGKPSLEVYGVVYMLPPWKRCVSRNIVD